MSISISKALTINSGGPVGPGSNVGGGAGGPLVGVGMMPAVLTGGPEGGPREPEDKNETSDEAKKMIKGAGNLGEAGGSLVGGVLKGLLSAFAGGPK